MNIPTFVILLMLCLPCSSFSIERAKICYVEVGEETYIPMTKDNVGHHCNRVGSVEPASTEFSRLKKLMSTSKAGVFADDAVRIRVEESSIGVVYIDKYGGISSSTGQFLFNKTEFAEFVSIVKAITSPNK